MKVYFFKVLFFSFLNSTCSLSFHFFCRELCFFFFFYCLCQRTLEEQQRKLMMEVQVCYFNVKALRIFTFFYWKYLYEFVVIFFPYKLTMYLQQKITKIPKILISFSFFVQKPAPEKELAGMKTAAGMGSASPKVPNRLTKFPLKSSTTKKKQ